MALDVIIVGGGIVGLATAHRLLEARPDLYIALFEKELGLKTVMMGFGLDSDAIHSPNEHYGLFNFYKGIETIPYFFHYFTKAMKS